MNLTFNNQELVGGPSLELPAKKGAIYEIKCQDAYEWADGIRDPIRNMSCVNITWKFPITCSGNKISQILIEFSH